MQITKYSNVISHSHNIEHNIIYFPTNCKLKVLKFTYYFPFKRQSSKEKIEKI